MSDQDFNFTPPPRREAKKPFEPPPWEKEQFEEIARRKEAERAAAEAEAAVVQTVAEPGPAPQAVQEPASQDDTAPAQAGPAGLTDQEGITADRDSDPPEAAHIDAMLVVLKTEEPPFGEGLWRIAVVAGAVLASVGAVLLVWGVAALATSRRTGVTGFAGGSTLMVFGLGFVGVGGWMVYRTLRQQGVL